MTNPNPSPILRALFLLESVAHLQAREDTLLPAVEAARDEYSRLAPRSAPPDPKPEPATRPWTLDTCDWPLIVNANEPDDIDRPNLVALIPRNRPSDPYAYPSHIAEANARHIVKCVNTHDALVSAVRKAHGLLNDPDADQTDADDVMRFLIRTIAAVDSAA